MHHKTGKVFSPANLYAHWALLRYSCYHSITMHWTSPDASFRRIPFFIILDRSLYNCIDFRQTSSLNFSLLLLNLIWRLNHVQSSLSASQAVNDDSNCEHRSLNSYFYGMSNYSYSYSNPRFDYTTRWLPRLGSFKFLIDASDALDCPIDDRCSGIDAFRMQI